MHVPVKLKLLDTCHQTLIILITFNALTLLPFPLFLQKSFVHFPPLSYLSLRVSTTMADHNPSHDRATRPNPTTTASTFLQRVQARAPNSAQLPVFLTASILLILTGITVTVVSLGFIFFMPLIIVSSPIWFPVAAALLVVSAGFFSTCGFGVLSVAGSCWMYRYFRGMHPPGSDRVDYARSRIYNTASHVKDYAIEYGGYLQSKVKDAAPGA